MTAEDIVAINRAACDNLLRDLQDIQSRAHRLGMHVTAHALNRAMNALGWEIAGDVEKAGKASRDERPTR
ncbi:MAG TPA: hypothetical protein VFW23_12510 [Tepidisphaeraceae bacterium]|nr:hypothetical protein [Tepidisphaeraceae bacterium]